MSKSSWQHYVPRFYLRGFAVPGGDPRQGPWFWYRGRGDKTWSIAYPRGVGADTHWYTLPNGAPQEPALLDDLVSQVEDKAAEPIKRVCSGNLPQARDEEPIATFVASLLIRTPTWRGIGRALMKATVLHRLAEHRAGRARLATDLLAFAETTERDGEPPIEWQKALPFVLLPKLIKQVEAMDWWFVRAAGATMFVASDQPVAIQEPGDHRPHFAGIDNPHSELTLPLSRDVALIARHGNQRLRATRAAGEGEVLTINRRTLSLARGEVFSPSKTMPGIAEIEALHAAASARPDASVDIDDLPDRLRWPRGTR